MGSPSWLMYRPLAYGKTNIPQQRPQEPFDLLLHGGLSLPWHSHSCMHRALHISGAFCKVWPLHVILCHSGFQGLSKLCCFLPTLGACWLSLSPDLHYNLPLCYWLEPRKWYICFIAFPFSKDHSCAAWGLTSEMCCSRYIYMGFGAPTLTLFILKQSILFFPKSLPLEKDAEFRASHMPGKCLLMRHIPVLGLACDVSIDPCSWQV